MTELALVTAVSELALVATVTELTLVAAVAGLAFPVSRLISGRCQTDIEIYIGPMSVFKAVRSRAAHILQRVLMSVRCRLLYRPDIEIIMNRHETDIGPSKFCTTF